MSHTFPHWEFRKYVKEFREEPATLAILTTMLSHCNIRLRCWPGMDLLVSETDWEIGAVTKAKRWLMERGAFVLVPYEKRVDREVDLPIRQHVYQMTGVLRTKEGVKPYIYMPPDEFEDLAHRILEIDPAGLDFNVSPDEVSRDETSPDEVSPGDTKGITSIKGNSSIKDSFADGEKTPPPASPPAQAPKKKRLPPRIGDTPATPPVKSETPLETFIAAHARGKLTEPMVRLLNTADVYWEGDQQQTGLSPNALFNSNPNYKQWIELVALRDAIKYNTVPGKPSASKLIGFIKNQKRFREWCAEEGHEAAPAAPDPKLQQRADGRVSAPSRKKSLFQKLQEDIKDANPNP